MSPEQVERYFTVFALAGSSTAARLTHTFDVVAGRVLCGRIEVRNIASAGGADEHIVPTCPICARRDPRAK